MKYQNKQIEIFVQIFTPIHHYYLELLGALAGADEGEYPHQVKFVSSKGGLLGSCGATVYNKDWVITAAHCISVDEKPAATADKSHVIVGMTDISQLQAENKWPIQEIITHENLDPMHINKGNDIALLRLAKPLNLEKGKIQPLKLVQAGYNIPYGKTGITIGWGVAGELGTVEQLKEFEVPIHHPAKSARLSFDTANAVETSVGNVPHEQIMSVAGDESGYIKKSLKTI